ncbi:AbrB/MazE/SpoVT family DNA-binding domain-containing protein [Aliihoeflea aestuarii]|jgi:AbrB family looped-hinge helix DNA binding protein|uniref:AbrB/MazE/SpoVT family DNA-binding domain-containing protein n=1 Tax=Aliihoeflea aestuarii TaxID=453840 RepID=UPI00209289D1|nr:AbrB/MazE/SpoVT family DNA-binding domain-containing protein [Aliihoeflea aestuarii]MCO6391354.1 AbrB/MazE/SpoVT family DNA-binding domain-containing protein [Aliihoeflea aestuarii]
MRVTEKGQVTIPKAIRDHLGIKPGMEVDFVQDGSGARVVRVASNRSDRRAKAIEAWADRVTGTLDLDGMDGKEYVDWLRGPRDDLDPR